MEIDHLHRSLLTTRENLILVVTKPTVHPSHSPSYRILEKFYLTGASKTVAIPLFTKGPRR